MSATIPLIKAPRPPIRVPAAESHKYEGIEGGSGADGGKGSGVGPGVGTGDGSGGEASFKPV